MLLKNRYGLVEIDLEDNRNRHLKNQLISIKILFKQESLKLKMKKMNINRRQ